MTWRTAAYALCGVAVLAMLAEVVRGNLVGIALAGGAAVAFALSAGGAAR